MQTTILVVDDTVSTRRPIERLLGGEGFATRSAGNGLEALRMIEGAMPDLVLLDLSMPCMDGFEVLGRLRDMPRFASLPVIVMTGETSPDAVVRAMDLGAREVLLKSAFTPQTLFTSIRRQLVA